MAKQIKALTDLKPQRSNANLHTERGLDVLRDSLQRDGWIGAMTVAADGETFDGSARLEVGVDAGFGDAIVVESDGTRPVIVKRTDIASADDPKAKRLGVAANRVAQLDLNWDSAVLAELESEGDALKGLFSADELLELLNAPEEESAAAAGLTDADEVPENAPTRCKSGQLWRLGRHRLLCGDSTSAEDVARLMGGEKADVWLTDPPYNVAYEGKTADALTIQNDSMSDLQFRDFLTNAFKCAFSAMKAGAAFYVWHADLEGYNFRGAVFEVGQRVRQCLVWVKQTLVMGRQDYHWKHEPCLYGWKDGAAHKWSNDRKQVTVLEFDRPSRSAEHPTMKPVDLFAYCLTNNSNAGDVILDTFLGSGTTLIAAEQKGRKCYGLELSPKYCDVILKRWEDFTGQTAELIENGN